MGDKQKANLTGYACLVAGIACLMFATDLDYWHGVALSMGIALTALAVLVWWEIS